MKLKSTSLLIAGALFGAAVMPAHASNEAMMDLLKVLHQRGTITDADYELLANAAKADKEAGDAVAMKVDKVETKVDTKSASLQALEWAERIKIKGDMRFRHETENVDAGSGSSKTNEEDRLRIRARLGVYADINDTTKAGIRLVSSPGSATSTNLSLENNFGNSFAGIDLAYIDWAPEMLGGNTNIVVGKMKKQWVQVNDVIWDGDTNPEGASIKSKFDLGGVNLIPSAGYYTLDDNGNDSFTEDSHVGHAQLAAEFGDAVFGVSYYGFENMNTVSEEERMFEIFGETAIPGTPVTVFAGHVTNSNADASGDDDNAWSLGATAKLGDFKLGYEYRDLGVNAVNDAFDNSDFLSDSEGSIFKAAYTIDKNFTVGATYYTSESNISGSDLEVDLLHLDLVAKF